MGPEKDGFGMLYVSPIYHLSVLSWLRLAEDPSLVLGQRRYLSPTDIRRLNAHYSCLGTTTASTTTTESATTTAASVTSQKCNGLIPNYADPTDCTRFYVCSGTKATLMVCPSGLYYNPVNYVCDWPANVYCPLDGDSNSTADK